MYFFKIQGEYLSGPEAVLFSDGSCSRAYVPPGWATNNSGWFSADMFTVMEPIYQNNQVLDIFIWLHILNIQLVKFSKTLYEIIEKVKTYALKISQNEFENLKKAICYHLAWIMLKSFSL